MDSSLQLPALARLLALNTEIHEMRKELMRQSLSSARIAQLQEGIDLRRRASLTICWLSEGYELEADEDDLEGLTGAS